MRITGFGVIDHHAHQLTYVGSGCVRTAEGSLPSRLKLIMDNLREIILRYRPEQVAIEQVFFNVNPKSTLLLGQARGAAICAAVLDNLEVAEYTALQIKQAVAGNGHAHKDQVQAMVIRLLNLAGKPGADAADALACAICHAHSGSGLIEIGKANMRMKRGRLV